MPITVLKILILNNIFNLPLVTIFNNTYSGYIYFKSLLISFKFFYPFSSCQFVFYVFYVMYFSILFISQERKSFKKQRKMIRKLIC